MYIEKCLGLWYNIHSKLHQNQSLLSIKMRITELTDDLVFSVLRPRTPESNKGTYGTLSCICGSARFPGAAALAVSSALRSGAGIVRLLSTDRVVAACSSQIKEAVYEILTSNDTGGISSDSIDSILGTVSGSSAVLCGCGLGNTEDTLIITEELIREYRRQIILDADALNAVAAVGKTFLLDSAARPVIITPHIGEMSRLCGLDIKEIKSDRAGCALRFSEAHRCVTVLKDNVTFIAAPECEVYESTAGNAGLARGGSGDTLAGMISSFAAQGYSPVEAAICGVHLHGRAADICSKRMSQYGMLPSDILYDLCQLFLEKGF